MAPEPLETDLGSEPASLRRLQELEEPEAGEPVQRVQRLQRMSDALQWLWMVAPLGYLLLLIPPAFRLTAVLRVVTFSCGALLGVGGATAILLLQTQFHGCCLEGCVALSMIPAWIMLFVTMALVWAPCYVYNHRTLPEVDNFLYSFGISTGRRLPGEPETPRDEPPPPPPPLPAPLPPPIAIDIAQSPKAAPPPEPVPVKVSVAEHAIQTDDSLFETLIAERMRELKRRIKTESAMTQTAWHRDPDEGFAKTTESLKLQKEQTAKKFGLEPRSQGPSFMSRGLFASPSSKEYVAAGVQTLLSGPSPYANNGPPRSWLPMRVTRDIGSQYHRQRPERIEPDPEQPTREIGVQSFFPLKPSTALAVKEPPPKPPSQDVGCGPGPWQFKIKELVPPVKIPGSPGSPELPTPLSTARLTYRSGTSPRLPRVMLVFYNARATYSPDSTPRRLMHSAAVGQNSVEAMEPCGFYCPLPSAIEFFVRLRTVQDEPSLIGKNWRAPLQMAKGYASKRSIIWPSAPLDFERIVGQETEPLPERMLELEVVVPGAY